MGNAIIKTENMGKTYRAGDILVPALKDISIEIKQGEFVAIMGASGSGKSTLLRQLGLLDKPSEGKYYLNNFDTSKIKEEKKSFFRLKNMGYIFQEYALLEDLTVKENVYLPLLMAGINTETCKKRAEEILTKMGLGNKLNKTKNQLSGGEQQRVAIARALINNSQLIFADEPCANLDSKNSKQILETLKILNEKMNQTIIMVTHEEWHTEYVTRVITLGDGKIIKDESTLKTTPTDISQNENTFKQEQS